jgi:hypothetical protein
VTYHVTALGPGGFRLCSSSLWRRGIGRALACQSARQHMKDPRIVGVTIQCADTGSVCADVRKRKDGQWHCVTGRLDGLLTEAEYEEGVDPSVIPLPGDQLALL